MSFFERLKQNFPKDWTSRLILTSLLVLSMVGAFFGYRMIRRLVAGTTAFTLPGDPVTSSDGNTSEDDDSTITGDTTSGVTLPNPDPWDGTSRVNILMMGLDLREGETEADAPRSDTMILLSMDPLNNTASILAIPGICG